MSPSLLVIAAISAAVGAVVAALVNSYFAWLTKRNELHVQRLNIALKCAELKHQQLVVSQDWKIRTNQPTLNVDHWDPLMSVIDYMNGMKEYDKTGDWAKGRAGTQKRPTG